MMMEEGVVVYFVHMIGFVGSLSYRETSRYF